MPFNSNKAENMWNDYRNWELLLVIILIVELHMEFRSTNKLLFAYYLNLRVFRTINAKVLIFG